MGAVFRAKRIGHSVPGWHDDMMKDTHDWFDEHFGPIAPTAPAATPANVR